jgi:peptidoglycan/LPS O-acetylase OafA/YrhL
VMMQVNKSIHIQGLNVLRFVAAFMIMIYHALLNFIDSIPRSFHQLYYNLSYGVDLFFLISGFLIVYLLLLEKKQNNTIHLLSFYARRILRIFPLYYLIVGIAYVMHHGNASISFISQLFFAGNFWMIHQNAWNVGIVNPLWSLCVEEHFYLLIPIFISILPSKSVLPFFGSIILGSILYRFYIYSTVADCTLSILLHTISRADVLAIGGGIAYLYIYFPRILRVNAIVFLVSLFLFLAVCLFANYSHFTSASKTMFTKYLFITPLTIIFIGFLFNFSSNTLLNKIKQNRIFYYLGKISFGIYLFHSPVIDALRFVDTMPGAIFCKPLFTCIITVLLASISYYSFEKYFLNFKSKFAILPTQS